MMDQSKKLLVETNLPTNIVTIEKWLLEKRKQSYFKSTINKSSIDHGTSEFQKIDTNEVEIDNLIEKAWIYGDLFSFTILLNLIKTNKMNGN